MLSLFKYKFSHEINGDLLRVTYTGKIKKKQMDEIMNRIYALLHKHNSNRILIDSLKGDVHLELNEILSIAKTHPPIFKRAKTAVVEKESKQSQYKLYQTVTENHDVNLCFFNSIKEAEEWLAK
jgi:hypothetical protein